MQVCDRNTEEHIYNKAVTARSKDGKQMDSFSCDKDLHHSSCFLRKRREGLGTSKEEIVGMVRTF